MPSIRGLFAQNGASGERRCPWIRLSSADSLRNLSSHQSYGFGTIVVSLVADPGAAVRYVDGLNTI